MNVVDYLKKKDVGAWGLLVAWVCGLFFSLLCLWIIWLFVRAEIKGMVREEIKSFEAMEHREKMNESKRLKKRQVKDEVVE